MGVVYVMLRDFGGLWCYRSGQADIDGSVSVLIEVDTLRTTQTQDVEG